MRDRFAVPRTLPPDVARRLLARAQRLAAPEREDGAALPDLVRAVAGLQAQDAPAAALGIRARRAGSTRAEVDRAGFEDRSIVRAWVMRGTLHLIPAEDARWMLALLGPVGLARGRRRRAELGVNAPEAVAAVRAALADGPRTRHEVAGAVRASGVRLENHPQVPVHLIACAAQAGHVIEAGPGPTYALIDDWLGPPRPGPDDPLAELARRHAHAHPPSGPEDFATWSGLPMRDARRAYQRIAPELEEVAVLGRSAWVPKRLEPAPPHVRLLPAFDGLLLGHRDRSLILRPEHDRAVRPGGGILSPTLIVDGQVEGTWRLERGRPTVTSFGAAPDYEDELADVVRFRAATAPARA
jgi:urease gamma subunit